MRPFKAHSPSNLEQMVVIYTCVILLLRNMASKSAGGAEAGEGPPPETDPSTQTAVVCSPSQRIQLRIRHQQPCTVNFIGTTLPPSMRCPVELAVNVCAAAVLGAALSLGVLYLAYACVAGNWSNSVPKAGGSSSAATNATCCCRCRRCSCLHSRLQMHSSSSWH